MKNQGCIAPTSDGSIVCGRPVLRGRRICIRHVDEQQPEALFFFVISNGDDVGSWRLAPVGIPAISNRGEL